MTYVYILRSQNLSSKLYIGITSDLKRRVIEHNQEKSGYSKKYAPWKMETFIGFKDKRAALAFERYLKSGSGFAFLKKRFLPEI